MAIRYDIILDDDGDIACENGDFKVGPADEQNIMLLLNTYPGNWKQFPTAGVGLRDYLLSSGKANELRRKINVQLPADGYKGDQVILKSNASGVFDYTIKATD